MSERTKLLVAAAVCLIGVVVVGVAWRGWGAPKQRAHAGITVPGEIAAARNAKLEAPTSPEEVARAVDAFTEHLTMACARLAPEVALPADQASELVALSRERLSILLEPDFTRYLDHVRRLTGRNIGPDGSGLAYFRTREVWDSHAAPFRRLPIDIRGVEVRARWKGGREIEGTLSGHVLGVSDYKNFYSSVPDVPSGPGEAGADVYDVRVPIGVADAANGARVRGFLVMSFVRTPREPRWAPLFMGINEPTGGDAELPPPWL